MLTTVTPESRRTGGEIATAAFVEAIRSSGRRTVTLGYSRAGDSAPLHTDDRSAGFRPIETSGAGLRPLPWLAGALVRREPYSLSKFRSREYLRLARELAAGEGVEIVAVDHAQSAWALDAVPAAVPVVYLAHNAEHVLYSAAASRRTGPRRWIERREARLMRGTETALLRRAGRAWTLSQEDAAALGALVPEADRSTFALPPSSDEAGPRSAAPDLDVGLIGTWTWDANAAGLTWFMERVLPLIDPALRIGVAGVGAERITDGKPSVESLGFVEDPAAFRSRCRVIALPSVAGGGVQISTIDALASGVPVVATGVAMRGLAERPPTVRSADQPEGFADAISEHLGSPPNEAASDRARLWGSARRDAFERAVSEALESVTR